MFLNARCSISLLVASVNPETNASIDVQRFFSFHCNVILFCWSNCRIPLIYSNPLLLQHVHATFTKC